MFENTLDRKTAYTNNEGEELIDLTESIFSSNLKSITCSFYKVTKEMEMRPDLLSIASFGEDTYTEMIMKYSEIDNPFAIEEDDVVAIPSLNNVYNEVKDVILSNNSDGENNYDLVKNYHKYIDKSKIPSSMGSETSSIKGNKDAANNKNLSNTLLGTNNSPIEPNMTNNGSSGISILNGRIYFGPNVSADTTDITDIDGNNIVNSDLVDCAKNGTSIGQFLNATVKNSLKN